MFGYVTVYKPELKVKEYETYKGVYCTLCKELGKEYGFFSRFLLSYDGAFYVIFKMGLKNEIPCAQNSRCSFNPTKKCLKITFKNDIYKLSCTIVVLLAYFKLLDNINDSSIFRKIGLYLILPYFAHLKNKAKKKYPEIYKTLEKGMNDQFETEKNIDVSIDKSADATAKMLGYLFSYGEQDIKKDFSYKFGYYLGRTVYFMDAFDDYEKDLKSHSFNPFKNSKNFIDDSILSINLSVGELATLLKGFKLIAFNEIIDNVVYDGLHFQLEKIIQRYRGDANE